MKVGGGRRRVMLRRHGGEGRRLELIISVTPGTWFMLHKGGQLLIIYMFQLCITFNNILLN